MTFRLPSVIENRSFEAFQENENFKKCAAKVTGAVGAELEVYPADVKIAHDLWAEAQNEENGKKIIDILDKYVRANFVIFDFLAVIIVLSISDIPFKFLKFLSFILLLPNLAAITICTESFFFILILTNQKLIIYYI